MPYVFKIELDESPQDPREFSTLSKIVMFHRRYTFHNELGLDANAFRGWDDMAEYIRKKYRPVAMEPIRMYDHSGVTLTINPCARERPPFNCPWDSMWAGFILVTREDALREFGAKRVTKRLRDRCQQIMAAEFEEYAAYVRGDVYGYVISLTYGDEFEPGDEYDPDDFSASAETFIPVASSWGYCGWEGYEQAREDARRHCLILEAESAAANPMLPAYV